MSNLRNLKTDLKSLKYSKDRPDLGYSGQPFIQKDIDKEPTNNSTEDFLLRGGLNAIPDAAEDVGRLSKYFFNLKSPSGFLFIAKQNLLSKTSVKTQASNGGGYGGFRIPLDANPLESKQNGPINQGVYTPLSTLLQAGTGFLGAHVNFLGTDPTSPMTLGGKELYNTGLGLNTYDSIIKNEKLLHLGDNPKIINNRLINLAETISLGISYPIGDITYNPSLGQSGELMSYQGGPGAILGFGKTSIRKASHSIGLNLTPRTILDKNSVGKSMIFAGGTKSWTYNELLSITQSGINYTLVDGSEREYKPINFSTTFNKAESQQRDFRVPILKEAITSTVTGIAPSYNPENSRTIDGRSTSRINYSSPGQKGDIISYTRGKLIDGKRNITDRINFLPIYNSQNVRGSDEDGINDLVKFRVATLLRDGKKIYTHFRAFINSFTDNYSSKWDSLKYMGRGEDFYKYGGFSRGVSVSFTVAAQSRPELMAQYKKLNFIASTLAPEYGTTGLMGGALHQLTLGGWCYELPGFISKFDLSVPTESPWEIAINDTVSDGKGTGDNSVKEMPHIVNVSMTFTPIHKFRPELQDNDYEKTGGSVSKYGPQQYIALSNSTSTEASNYQYTPTLKEAEKVAPENIDLE